jgi:PhoPQ-activated pathogenicity-related protein
VSHEARSRCWLVGLMAENILFDMVVEKRVCGVLANFFYGSKVLVYEFSHGMVGVPRFIVHRIACSRERERKKRGQEALLSEESMCDVVVRRFSSISRSTRYEAMVHRGLPGCTVDVGCCFRNAYYEVYHMWIWTLN